MSFVGNGHEHGFFSMNEGNAPFEKIAFRATGRVQGVCFRAYAQDAALQRDVTGWIRNCPDGRRVEGEAWGRPEAVESFIRWLYDGSPYARVDRVDVDRLGPQEDRPPSFEIRF